MLSLRAKQASPQGLFQFMPSFDYQALNANGKSVKGTQTADSAYSLRSSLRAQGLTPVSVNEVQTASRQTSGWWQASFWRGYLPLKELVLLTRQIATLLEGGLPLAQVLSILSAQAENKRLGRLLTHVHGQVQEGQSLANAFRNAPYRLPEDVVAMIGAGEASGNLTVVMARLADAIELREQVSGQMKGAMFYPILMVPKVVVMFTHMKQSLPPLTQGLIAVSDWLAHWWFALILLLLGAFGVFKWLLKRDAIRFRWHQLLLRLPLFGKLLTESNTARWARTLSVLLNSGVPAVEALRISAQVLSLLPQRLAVDNMAVQVREGVPLYRALAESKAFPSLVRYLVESGEASGRLPDMLGRVAHHYEVSTQALSGSLIKLIEPVLILVMGGVVLLIVMAILLPIFAMNQLVG
ncbi:MAG: hypothetical protein B7X52_05085 [Thiotrichales bacterium 34-46-19]|nr:MAG: hypothetical protein B7X52_05085 [Thiotrichales bacterium 34-46-19]